MTRSARAVAAVRSPLAWFGALAIVIASALPAAAASSPVLPMALWGEVTTTHDLPVTQGDVTAVLGGQPAGELAISASGAYGGPGGLDPKLSVQGDGAVAGAPITLEVNALAATATVVGGSGCSLSPGAALTFAPGSVCQVNLTVAAASPLAVATRILPGATVGAAYSAALSANGGSTPYTWSVIAGSLPAGLTLDPATGTIQGTPTAAGSASFTVQVADSSAPTQVATAGLAITVAPSPTVPDREQVSVSPATVTANGVAAATVTATVYGATGEALPGVPVTFTTTLGQLSTTGAVPTDSEGVAADRLGSATAGTATVTAKVAGIAAGNTAQVTFVAPQVPASPLTPPASTTGPDILIPLSVGFGSAPSGSVGTGTVGPRGGTIALLGGQVQLEVPRGAFSADVKVSVRQEQPGRVPEPPSGFAALTGLVITTSGGAEPHEPVRLVLHFDAKALSGLSPGRLGVYFYDPKTRAWTWVGGVVDPDRATVTVTLAHLSTYALLINRERFSDLVKTPWARTAVDELLGARIVDGVAAGRFAPDRSVTRAQFTKMLALADGLAPLSKGRLPFVDVAPSAWYAPYVRAAYEAGIVGGVSATRFDPEAPITRLEMAVMLSRLPALARTPAARLAVFRDGGKVPRWAAVGVGKALSAGLVHGFPDGDFLPQGTTTRAQAAVVIARYLRLIGKV